MSTSITKLVAQISALQDQLEDELAERRTAFHYHLERGRVVFERDVIARHRALKVRFWTFLRRTQILVVLTAPLIYVLIVPFVLLDALVTLYQVICFPIYKIAPVKRGEYIFLDRHRLAYLNGLQKLNCVYCGYGIGLLAYVSEIAARTEQFWCPIKRAKRLPGAHGRYSQFAEFGDAEAYPDTLDKLRQKLAQEQEPKPRRTR